MRRTAALATLAVAITACTGGGTATSPAPAFSSTSPPVSQTTTAITSTTTTEAAASVATDGVTVTDDTIYLGLLADLTGPFSGNVVDLVDAQIAFWELLNERGGIAGRSVELLVIDTGYDVTRHLGAYEDLKDKVVMFSHSTGSPHTAAIAPNLVADHRLAVPVSWYSGWADPDLGANVLEVGSDYCLEAMNALSFIASSHQDETGRLPTIAIATDQGDYGQDSAAGARYAADELGLQIVYDGEGQILSGADLGPIAAGIAAGGADYTWLATDPLSASTLVAGALSQGYQGAWSGAMPTFSPRLLDTALGDYLSQAWILSVLYAPMGADVAGMDQVYSVLADAFPARLPTDGLIAGFLEYAVTEQLLERAAEAGDLTPDGVIAAARATGQLDFGGISPAGRYAGTFNDSVARATALYRVSKQVFDDEGGLQATFSDGAVSPYTLLQDFFVSDLAAGYEFEQPCYVREG